MSSGRYLSDGMVRDARAGDGIASGQLGEGGVASHPILYILAARRPVTIETHEYVHTEAASKA